MALAFGLAEKGLKIGKLETKSVVTLDKDGDVLTVTKSSLSLHAKVPDISEEQFNQAVQSVKKNCPISKLLNCEMTLDIADFSK